MLINELIQLIMELVELVRKSIGVDVWLWATHEHTFEPQAFLADALFYCINDDLKGVDCEVQGGGTRAEGGR